MPRLSRLSLAARRRRHRSNVAPIGERPATEGLAFRFPLSTFPRPARGLTLIEMLISLAITLVMMAAVVNLFANMTASVRDRRAVIELSGQLRQVRQRLAKDLAGATCTPVPMRGKERKWIDPESNEGYIEIVEGPWSDKNPSLLITTGTNGYLNKPDGLNTATSLIPSSQTVNTQSGDVTNGAALGDYDDVLALTVRSEDEPFTAQVPKVGTVQSTLAEVIWFAVENPPNDVLGERGMRKIYRRALLVAPWLSPMSPPDSSTALTAADPVKFFQNYDVSAHFDSASGKWIPNTLADLTKRENRVYRIGGSAAFPNPLVSNGAGYNNPTIQFTRNTNFDSLTVDAVATAIVQNGVIVGYNVTNGGQYQSIPTLTLQAPTGAGAYPATARLVMKTLSTNPFVCTVAAITFGPPPLGLDRAGADLMLDDALAFDLRVYDPGAPLLANSGNVLGPCDAGWDATALAAAPNSITGYGAYVDLGWGWSQTTTPNPRFVYAYPLSGVLAPGVPNPLFNIPHQVGWHPATGANYLTVPLQPPFGFPCVYDTWSWHYEVDGIDEDNKLNSAQTWRDGAIDQGTNGIDDDNANGVDDLGERETWPPYNVPLRGVQVILRTYERDARQVREASVTHSFVP